MALGTINSAKVMKMAVVLLQVHGSIIVGFIVLIVALIVWQMTRRKKAANPLADPYGFTPNPEDENLFRTNNGRHSVRVQKVKSEYDQLLFSTSLPCFKLSLKDDGVKNIYLIPGISSIDPRNHYDIVIRKSPAADWKELQPRVLAFLFKLLRSIYAHQEEKQLVTLFEMGKTGLAIGLRVETCRHIALGQRLLALEGLVGDSMGNKFPSCMNYPNQYNFNIWKGDAFTWKELGPEIAKVFNEYFLAGVEFEGDFAELFVAQPETSDVAN